MLTASLTARLAVMSGTQGKQETNALVMNHDVLLYCKYDAVRYFKRWGVC